MLKKIDKSKLENIIVVILLFILALIVGINRTNISNFNPINGDFQNYNPIRRFLDGQIPYKDFAVYLGTGHLILLSFVQLIVGNNFTKSLFVTNAVTVLIFELTVFTVSFLVIRDKKKSAYLTLLITVINIIRPQFITSNLNQQFIQALDFGLAPGNSARLIRIAIAPILVLLLYVGYKFIDKSEKGFIVKNRELVKKVYISIISGLSIIWSNDGGVSTYISISFIYFLLLIKEYKKDVKSIIKYTFMYIGISLLSTFILLVVITRGNIFSWLQFTLGVSSYQKWYYGAGWAKENISLLSLDKSIFNIIMIVIAIYYVFKLIKEKEKNGVFKYAMLSFLTICSIISSYLYQLFSGGTSKDILNLILFILGTSYTVIILENLKNNGKIGVLLKKGTIIIALGAIISNSTTRIVLIKNRNADAIYIQELGGYFTQLGNSIKYASERIGNDRIFSTYASAVETVTGQFQPTGTDYIIHVLGDKQREEYINTFKQGDFKYVDTVDKNNGYRFWIRNSNWFFYRELYKEYKPVFTTEYNVFYEKNNNTESIEKNINIEKNQLNDSSYIIKLKSEDQEYDGVADVKISYNSKFKRSFFRTLDINKYVYIEDTNINKLVNNEIANYNIPSESDEWYIPITIIDGEGEIKITTYPTNNTELEIDDIEVINNYDVMFKYCYASSVDENDNRILYIDNTNENKIIMKEVKAIKIGDTTREVISYEEQDNYIKLELNDSAEEFLYPNFFEVIK